MLLRFGLIKMLDVKKIFFFLNKVLFLGNGFFDIVGIYIFFWIWLCNYFYGIMFIMF